MFTSGNMTDKLRDKTKKYKIKEEEYGHPLHEPYRRDRSNDRLNYLINDDEGDWPEDEDVPF